MTYIHYLYLFILKAVAGVEQPGQVTNPSESNTEKQQNHKHTLTHT